MKISEYYNEESLSKIDGQGGIIGSDSITLAPASFFQVIRDYPVAPLEASCWFLNAN